MQYEEALAVYERELAEYDRSVEAKAEWDLALKASHWRSLDGFAFEREMANLFREMDYRVATTPRTGCSAPGSLDTSLSHAAGLIEIAACHA